MAMATRWRRKGRLLSWRCWEFMVWGGTASNSVGTPNPSRFGAAAGRLEGTVMASVLAKAAAKATFGAPYCCCRRCCGFCCWRHSKLINAWDRDR
jgi:hypothetical protein